MNGNNWYRKTCDALAWVSSTEFHFETLERAFTTSFMFRQLPTNNLPFYRNVKLIHSVVTIFDIIIPKVSYNVRKYMIEFSKYTCQCLHISANDVWRLLYCSLVVPIVCIRIMSFVLLVLNTFSNLVCILFLYSLICCFFLLHCIVFHYAFLFFCAE